MEHKIFVINTGSTSTKIALFQGERAVYSRELSLSAQELKGFPSLSSQLPYRQGAIEAALEAERVDLSGLSAVAARGGTFGYAQGGAYLVEENLLEACRHPITDHPSNLSAILGHSFARAAGCNTYIYDAVCVDEVAPLARFTGLKGVNRRPFPMCLTPGRWPGSRRKSWDGLMRN